MQSPSVREKHSRLDCRLEPVSGSGNRCCCSRCRRVPQSSATSSAKKSTRPVRRSRNCAVSLLHPPGRSLLQGDNLFPRCAPACPPPQIRRIPCVSRGRVSTTFPRIQPPAKGSSAHSSGIPCSGPARPKKTSGDKFLEARITGLRNFPLSPNSSPRLYPVPEWSCCRSAVASRSLRSLQSHSRAQRISRVLQASSKAPQFLSVRSKQRPYPLLRVDSVPPQYIRLSDTPARPHQSTISRSAPRPQTKSPACSCCRRKFLLWHIPIPRAASADSPLRPSLRHHKHRRRFHSRFARFRSPSAATLPSTPIRQTDRSAVSRPVARLTCSWRWPPLLEATRLAKWGSQTDCSICEMC